MEYTHEELLKRQRTQLWLLVYVESIKKPNSDGGTAWYQANNAVIAFDETFCKPKETQP